MVSRKTRVLSVSRSLEPCNALQWNISIAETFSEGELGRLLKSEGQ
jgi:hypothetical protein